MGKIELQRQISATRSGPFPSAQELVSHIPSGNLSSHSSEWAVVSALLWQPNQVLLLRLVLRVLTSAVPESSTLSTALPKPPIDLIVTETTATSVTLTWDSGNSEPISYYGIQYRAAGTEGPFQEVDGVATTRYSIGGLSPFSEYVFRVLAVNSIGRGPPSEAVRARTGEQAPSSPPRRVQARMLSASTMLVQWEPPEEPNGMVRGYRVYYTPDSRRPLSAWHKHNTDAGLLTTVGSLLPGITYSLRVLAFTAVGDGPPSPTIQVKTQQGGRWAHVCGEQPAAEFMVEAPSSLRPRTWELRENEDAVFHSCMETVDIGQGWESGTSLSWAALAFGCVGADSAWYGCCSSRTACRLPGRG